MLYTDSLDQLATGLAAFQAEMPKLTKSHEAKVKTKTGGDYSYKYADLADAVTACAPVAAKHGLSVTQSPTYEHGLGDVLVTRLMHASGQWIESTMRLFLSQESPQAHGSAITYARRYAYCAALGIAADEDDDGAAATATAEKQAPAKATQRRPPPLRVVEPPTPKNRLLEACAGDKDLAARLWKEAFFDKNDGEGVTGTEIDLLLSRAKAEVEA